MVRPPPPGVAVAAAPGRPRRPLWGLALGNHAAADRRQNGEAVLREVSGALARRRGARPRLARRRAADVGWSRLLFSCAQFARLRGGGIARSWRDVSGHRARLTRTAGDRALYRRCNCRHRIRPPHHAGRRQHRARGVTAVRRRGAAAAGQTLDTTAGDNAARPLARRRYAAGADGPWLLDLYPEETGLRAVSAEQRLCEPCARRSGNLSAQGAEENRGAAPRGGFCG